MARDILLDLNTLIVRPTIAVDGKLYELHSIDELSILQSQRFTVWGKEIETLANLDDEESASRLAELLARVAAAAIVSMPAGVFEKLTEAHHMAIAQVFTGLLLARKMATAGAMAKEMLGQSTGEKPSPSSSASTAALQAGGSKKRQRRS